MGDVNHVIQTSSWLSDIHNVLALLVLLATGGMSIIGYKVHALLFEMKIPERMAKLEEGHEDHEKRLDKMENKVFGVYGGGK